MDAFSALRAIAALMLVLGLVLGLGWALRRYGGSLGVAPRPRSDLSVIETRALDARRRLSVVRWGGEDHLLCLGPSGDTLIARRPAPASPPSGEESGRA